MASEQQRPFRLALKPELVAGQTLMSFVSALASLNGLRSTARLCLAFGLDLTGLKSGNLEAVARFSDLTGIALDRLLTAAYLAKPRANTASHGVDAIDLAGGARVCLHCLTDDHHAHHSLRFETAVYYRAAWSHALVRSCAVHGCLLMPLPERQMVGDPRNDFAAAVRQIVSGAGFQEPVASLASPVEIYIQDRLAASTGRVPFLDALAMNDALFLCRYLGAPHRESHRAARSANIEDRLERTNRGFLIAAQGTDAIRAKLEEVARIVNPHGAAEIGLRRVFMDLFDRVRDKTELDALALRQLLVDIGATQNLIDFEQTEALGLPVPQRDRQTIESASRRFGISDRELRAALIHLKAIPHDEVAKSGKAVLFDVAPIASVLSRLKASLNLVQTAQLLGLHPQQVVRICDARLLKPFFTRPSADLKPLRYFERSDVEGFLDKLTANCVVVRDIEERVDIWEAGLKTCRQPVDIIAAIHDGRIARTYRLRGPAKVRTLLVDLEDVRDGVFETGDELVSAEDCSRTLTINILAMRAIMQRGFLESELGTNPINRRQQLSARLDVVQAFDRKYVSLNGLCQQYGSSGSGMAQALHRCGIKPAFPPDQSLVRIYRRAAIQRVHQNLQQIICHREIRNPSGMSRKVVY